MTYFAAKLYTFEAQFEIPYYFFVHNCICDIPSVRKSEFKQYIAARSDQFCQCYHLYQNGEALQTPFYYILVLNIVSESCAVYHRV